MKKSYCEILFDLDGTLIDPKEGITKSIQFALEKLGAPIPAADSLHWCIGPSLKDSFRKLLSSPSDAELKIAVSFYRERYAEMGMYEHFVYPGIELLLKLLQKEGFRLFVATAKPEFFAEKIIQHFGLGSYFERIYGAELDGIRTDKGELLRYIWEESSLRGPALMVGDRHLDMVAAVQNQIDPLGVAYGYGSKEELIQAGACAVCDSPMEVYQWIHS